jgi:hypothetical protein
MKRFSLLSGWLLVVFLAALQSALARPAYLRSGLGPPWNASSNEAAMDLVFGAGNWDDLRYENVDTAALFSAATEFIFMEGGDSNADRLEAFIFRNRDAMEAWVDAGGALFVNAAPNVGDGMVFGFQIQLVYGGPGSAPPGCHTGQAVDPSHPIFNGPFTPVGTVFQANWFCHGTVRASGAERVIENNAGRVALGALRSGAGIVLFGSMTTANFHIPQPEASNLRANIIAFTASGGAVSLSPFMTMNDEAAVDHFVLRSASR